MEQTNLENFKPGTLIIQENDKSRKMYIIKQGKVKVYKNYMNQKITLAVLSEGEIFGELSFFDAAPRTASVEALTDVSLVVLDGAQNIEGLPKWLNSIFKTIVERFRAADEKITLLQSMYEFQKKNQKTDKLAQTIYAELLRFIKAIKTVYNDHQTEKIDTHNDKFFKEVKDMLGECYISFKVFWTQLREKSFVSPKNGHDAHIVISNKSLDKFEKYLRTILDSDNCFILSHTALAILKTIVGQNNPGEINIATNDSNFNHIDLFEEGINNLTSKKILTIEKDAICSDLEKVTEHYNCQSILKSFDFSSVDL